MNLSDTLPLSYDPYDPEIDADPYPVWESLRETKPLYFNERYDFYALSRFDDIQSALVDLETFQSGRGNILEIIKANRPLPPGILPFEDPPIHSIHRRLATPFFSPRAVSRLSASMRQICATILDPLRDCDGFDFVRDIGEHLPARAIAQLLGIPDEEQRTLRQRTNSRMDLVNGQSMLDKVDPLAVSAILGDYVHWRAKNPSDDPVTHLLTTEFESPEGGTRTVTMDEALVFVHSLASAGGETITRLIGWIGKVLADHPDQLSLLAREPSRIPQAIEEILRFETPSPVQARFVARGVTLHGQHVPEGSTLLLINASGNRDRRRFERPDKFDVRRQFSHHLAFGHGPHFCIGAALARLEAKVLLEELMRRWASWEVDHSNAVMARTSTVRGWQSLPVLVR